MSAPDWTFRVIAALLALGGLALLYLGMFHDRSRGRRRCPRCWYDMAGTSDLKCPECGSPARDEQALARTHRYWILTAAGAGAIVAAVAASQWPRFQDRGWWGFAPNDLLLRMLPAPGDEVDPATGRLRPILVELARRDPESFASRHWPLYLRGAQIIQMRPCWPQEHPLLFGVRFNPGDPRDIQTWVTPRLPGAVAVSTFSSPWPENRDAAWSAGPLAPGSKSVVFDVQVVMPLGARRERNLANVLWTGTVSMPIELVGSVDEVIAPDPSEKLTALIRSALKIGYRPSRYRPQVGIEFKTGVLPPGLAAGVRVRLVCRGRTVGTYDFPSPLYPWPEGLEVKDAADFQLPGEGLPLPRDVAEGWSLEVSGAGELALGDFASGRYWSGRFTVPLAEAMANSKQMHLAPTGLSIYEPDLD